MVQALQGGGPPLRVELQHGREEGGELLGLLHTPVILVHLGQGQGQEDTSA